MTEPDGWWLTMGDPIPVYSFCHKCGERTKDCKCHQHNWSGPSFGQWTCNECGAVKTDFTDEQKRRIFGAPP
jgi:hypothetical protein